MNRRSRRARVPAGALSMNPRVLVRGLILIASLAAFGYVLEASQLGTLLDRTWIDNEVRGKGMAGELLFLAAGGFFTAVGMPRQVIGFLGGYAFGFTFGGVLALIASTLGCIGAFYYARLLGRAPVMSRFPRRVRTLDDFLRGHPFSMTLLVRLLPIGSNLVTNLVAGVSSVRATAFFAGSAIGYIPQTAVFALVGSGSSIDPGLRIGLAVVLFVVSGALGVYLYRRFRHGKSFDEATERAL